MWRVLLVALTRVVTLWPIYVYWWLMVGGVFCCYFCFCLFLFSFSFFYPLSFFFPFIFFFGGGGGVGGMCDSLTYHNILLWYLFQVAILVRLQ